METVGEVSPAVQSLTKQVKERQWLQTMTELRDIKDGLGKGIDEGILESVAALNLLGINTSQSCEGHADWATGAPYIDIEAKGTEEAERLAGEAFAHAREVQDKIAMHTEHTQNPANEVATLYDKAYKLQVEADRPHLIEKKKVMLLLDDFYKDRQVPYDQRITIQSYGNRSRIESQGAALQQIAETEEKVRKLKEYQNEIHEFTTFLKQKIMAD